MTTDLNIGVERGEAATLVVLRGDLDLATAPELRECLVKVIDEGERVVIDLEAVGFLDSAGLGILVGGLKRARTRGGELELVCTARTCSSRSRSRAWTACSPSTPDATTRSAAGARRGVQPFAMTWTWPG